MINVAFNIPSIDKNNIKIKGYDFTVKRDIHKQYNYIKNINSYGTQNFRELINKFADFSYSFILLIDEYEYLFHSTFSSDKPIYIMRSIAQRKLPNNQRLRVCFAGSRSWEHLNELNIPGSPDFTFLANTIYLKPLQREDCHALLTSRLKKTSMKYEKNKIDELVDQAYSLSGGCPNVINYVGYDFIKNGGKINSNDIYKRLIPTFSTRWSNLSDSEQSTIILESLEYDDILSELRLIKETSNNNYELVGELWQKFVFKKRDEINKHETTPSLFSLVNHVKSFFKSSSKTATSQYNMKLELEIKAIKEQIDDIIEHINEECRFRGILDVFNFEDSHDHTYQLNALSKLCRNKEQFSNFISNLYTFLYESTFGPVYEVEEGNRYYCYQNKKNQVHLMRNCARLPNELWWYEANRNASLRQNDSTIYKSKDKINPNSDILHHINTIRGNYQHTRDKKSQVIPVRFKFPESMIVLYNKKKNPSSEQDFINLQRSILNALHRFLIYVKNLIEKEDVINYIDELTT